MAIEFSLSKSENTTCHPFSHDVPLPWTPGNSLLLSKQCFIYLDGADKLLEAFAFLFFRSLRLKHFVHMHHISSKRGCATPVILNCLKQISILFNVNLRDRIMSSWLSGSDNLIPLTKLRLVRC